VNRVRLLAALLALPPAAAAGDLPAQDFARITIPVDGRVAEARVEDVDGDGRRDLLLTVIPAGHGSRREVRVHLQDADGLLPAVPSQVVKVQDDVIVCGLADVRAEPGRELLFLTRSGAFSYSLTLSGFRDNIRRLATLDLLFQVPSPRALNVWSYVIERPGGDLLLLPGGANVTLWGPRAAPAPATEPPADDYELLASLGGDERAQLFSVKAPGAVSIGAGGAAVRVDTGDEQGLFLGEAPAAFTALLQADTHYRAPALADVDGDGRRDLLLRRDDLLHVHLAGPRGPPAEPTRSEPLPEWLLKPETDLILRPADLDGDGDVDLLARLSPEDTDLGTSTFNYFVLLNDGARLLPEQPHQVLRFEATGTESELTDVDGDGRTDLVVTKWTLPSLSDIVTGFRLERAAYVYPAAGGKDPFTRKPVLRDEQSFTLESLQDALVLRRIPGDFTGDGAADLVEIDLAGRVAVRRILREEGAFGGGDWSLHPDAWKRFDLGADVTRLQLQDINGDGLVDLLNPRDGAVELALSRGARR